MNELVHSIVPDKLLSALRQPSFAGRGLPERMRSTAFALLGMTAAAALFLVAIFAQLSFPLVEPTPLPDEPTTQLGGAERVTPGTGSLLAAGRAPAPARRTAVDDPSPGGRRDGVAAAPQAIAAPDNSTAVQAPGAVAAPAPGSGTGTGASTGDGGREAGAKPATSPSSEPTPAAAPSETQADSGSAAPPAPAPVSPPPKATTSAPTPLQPVAPGNSSSSAAAEHASDRGIEASSSSASTESSVVSEPSDGNGNGNGLAKGQSK
jgi:hypothetical protein